MALLALAVAQMAYAQLGLFPSSRLPLGSYCVRQANNRSTTNVYDNTANIAALNAIVIIQQLAQHQRGFLYTCHPMMSVVCSRSSPPSNFSMVPTQHCQSAGPSLFPPSPLLISPPQSSTSALDLVHLALIIVSSSHRHSLLHPRRARSQTVPSPEARQD